MTATEAGGSPAMDPGDQGANSLGGERLGDDGSYTDDPGGADTDVIGMGSKPRRRVSAEQSGRIAALRARLTTPMPDDGIWGWVGPLLVTAFAAFFRFDGLGTPRAIIFDETYYAKDAWSILQHGVELCDKSNANNLILAGHTNIFQACSYGGNGEYVVQPEFGKLAIAVGEWLFGLNSVGWRVAPAIFGSLAILLMCRIARRFTRSTLLGCLAGLLLSLDGLEFVLSRTGILDIFLMFWVLAAFGCLLVDRDVSRSRLAERTVLVPSDEAGPPLGIRKWRVLAGLCLGLACASKQYAAWYVIAFIILALAWDIGARRAAGLHNYLRGALVRDGKWLPLTLGVIPLVTYVITWTNWFVTDQGYDRNYAAAHGVTIPVISELYSLFEYHVQMLQFGVGLNVHHPYQSQPWNWIVISRPVAFYWNCYSGPTGAHAISSCTTGDWGQEVLAMGNPAIWWASIPAMLFCLGWWLTRRDWRAGAVLFAVAAGWLTWFPFVSRTKFFYYALEFEPFLILCIVLCLGLIIGPVTASLARRAVGSAVVGAYVLAVLALFWYFYPIWAGKIIPYSDWLSHMWYHGWI
jgi:dolichyl-phosphate-mannose-protein mannosyltransferase